MPSHASVSKYYADKTYANLWFILLQVTKGFRFQKNKFKMYVSFLATFHLTDFREKWKQYDMVLTYFNQQAPTVSVFRIYHTETHMTNIC